MKAVRIAPRSPRASRWQLNVFTKTRKNGRWYHFRYHSVFGGLRQHRGDRLYALDRPDLGFGFSDHRLPKRVLDFDRNRR